MDIVFVAPYVPTSTDTLKLAALYFDRVTIHDRALLDVEPIGDMQHVRKSGIIRRIIPSVDGSLRESIRPLLDEGLIVINSSPSSMLIPPRQRERLRELFGDVKELLFGPAYDSGHEVEVELDESGIAEIHQRLAGPITVGGKFDVGAVYTYYEGLFVEAVGAALRGEPILSCSSILYDMLDRAAEADAVKSLHADRLLGGAVGPRLALDVLSTALVDTGDLDCFDVLEVRYQLRDELVAFRSELERVQFEFTHEFGIEKMLREGHAIAAARHAPRVRELEAKIKSGRVLVLKKLIKSLEKPDAYVPLSVVRSQACRLESP